MADVPNYNLQPSFPIAGIADLIANRPYKEAQMRHQQQQQLLEGMQMFGQGVQSLVNRRQTMAQALAGAQIYGQTPEGQQLMGTNQVTSSPTGTPVQQNQTAAYDPQTESVTPNASPVNMGTLRTALLGETPTNILNNVSAQANTKKAYDLEAMKEANAQSIAKQHNEMLQKVFQGGLGAKYATINAGQANNLRDQITRNDTAMANLVKDLPSGVVSSFVQGILPSAKYSQAFTAYQAIKKQNDDYKQQLQGAGTGQGTGGSKHLSTAELLAIVNG